MKKVAVVVLSCALVLVLGLAVFFLASSLRGPVQVIELPSVSTASAQPTPNDNRSVPLYFLSTDHRFLVRERRTVALKGTLEDRLKTIVQELLSGPQLQNLLPTMPTGTRLESLFWDKTQQRVVVSLSQDFLVRHPGHALAEWASIYSLVNTIADQDSAIRSVQILVDGEIVEDGTLWDLSEPFAPDYTFVFYESGEPMSQ